MIGMFWNIRGLNKLGRQPALVSRIRGTQADVVGIIETKKSFSQMVTLNLSPGKLLLIGSTYLLREL
jgi:hypothetical protein